MLTRDDAHDAAPSLAHLGLGRARDGFTKRRIRCRPGGGSNGEIVQVWRDDIDLLAAVVEVVELLG